ncbi:unnamed protein product [Penicillium pancosmium]
MIAIIHQQKKPFEDSNASSREANMDLEKEDARHALEIAIKGLELRIDLNDSEYSIFRKMRRRMMEEDEATRKILEVLFGSGA